MTCQRPGLLGSPVRPLVSTKGPTVNDIDNAIRALRAAKPVTALPATRLDLEDAARRLEEWMAKRPTLITADVKGEAL